jgi:hypothetical protein
MTLKLNQSEKMIIKDALLEYYHERIKLGSNNNYKVIINNLIAQIK